MKGAHLLASAWLAAALAGCDHAPQQADGLHHRSFEVGNARVIAILDGVQPASNDALTNLPPQDPKPVPEPVPVNVFVFKLGERVVLVDAGGGSGLPGYRGMLAERLRAASVHAAQVTDILITHMHGDHVGGLSEAGKPLYPNATVHVHAAEAKFWLAPELPARAPEQFRPIILGIQASVSPYAQAGRVKTFEYGAQVLPGVFAEDAAGHTPGHAVYLWKQEGATALFWGDLVHAAGVQLTHPEVGSRFDSRPPEALASRTRWLAQAAREGWTVFGSHMPFPGVGRLEKSGAAYGWSRRGI